MVSPSDIAIDSETQASDPDLPADSGELNDAAERGLSNLGDTARASWRFSLDAIRANIRHCSTDAKELLVWAFIWSIDPAHPVPFREFCSRVGYNENTIYKVYSGKYTHPTTGARLDAPEKLVKALRSFRRTEQQRARLGRNVFVATPTAKRIFTACDLARESQSPVLIDGASQIGKTEAFRRYADDNNHGATVLVELEAVSGLGGLIKAIAKKIGISENSNTADLLERVKRAITPNMVVILDEVHLLANTYRRGSYFACMEAVRRLYDATQCGLVLSFTRLGFEKAEKERKRELEQIFRRGVHRVNLGDRPTLADVGAILTGWALEMPARNEEVIVRTGGKDIAEQPYAMLAQLAREAGLKAIVERLRYATKLAADHEAALTWDHVVRAHLILAKNAAAPDHGWGSEGGAK